jgi:hypothetical protein
MDESLLPLPEDVVVQYRSMFFRYVCIQTESLRQGGYRVRNCRT